MGNPARRATATEDRDMNTIYSREAVERCKTPKSLGKLNYDARRRAEVHLMRTENAISQGATDAANRMADIAAEHRDIAKAASDRIENLAAQHGGQAWTDAVRYATAHTAAAVKYADEARRKADTATTVDRLPATTGGAACGH